MNNEYKDAIASGIAVMGGDATTFTYSLRAKMVLPAVRPPHCCRSPMRPQAVAAHSPRNPPAAQR